MQNNQLKSIILSVAVWISAFILVLIRSAILLFGFDFETSFFKSEPAAYLSYLLLIICIALAVTLSLKTKATGYSVFTKHTFKDILNAFISVVFLAFTIIYVIKFLDISTISPEKRNVLEAVSYYICLPFSVLSAVYYLKRLFSSKGACTSNALLSLCPPIFLSAMLVHKFATVAASASSLSHFPDVISLLILAFFILSEGKNYIPGTEVTPGKALSMLLSITISLSFSAIPDLISVLSGKNVFDAEDTVFLILKFAFLIYSVAETVFFAKASKEDDQ